MELRTTVSTVLVLVCLTLPTIQGVPSVDPPSSYPAGTDSRRAVDPSAGSYDSPADTLSTEPEGSWPGLLPFYQIKPSFIPAKPVIDPNQFIQMKATLLKNLFGTGFVKPSLATRAAMPPPKSSKFSSSGPPKGKSTSPASYKPAAKPGASSKSSSWDSAWTSAAAQSAWNSPPASPAAAPQSSWNSPSAWSAASPSSQWSSAPSQPAWSAASPQSSWNSAPSAPASASPAASSQSQWAAAPSSQWSSAPSQPAWSAASPQSGWPSAPNPSPVASPPAPSKKGALEEALLAQFLSEATSTPSRFARTPLGAAPSPYLTDLLDSLNLTVPEPLPGAKPTIEPIGFWFPDVIATPGGAQPFAVDPLSGYNKKTKFLHDLFASKVTALATAPPPTPDSTLAAGTVDPAEYSAKVSTYLSQLTDSSANSPAKRSSGDDVPEDERASLRKKRAIGDDDTPAPTPGDPATIANDLATIKQNILIQLEALKLARSAEAQAQKAALKAAKAAAMVFPGTATPPPTPAVPAVPLEEYQQRIGLLTNLYGTVADLQKNITSPAGSPALGTGTLPPEKLFIAAVNAKVNEIMTKSALSKSIVARDVSGAGSGYNKRWRGQDNQDGNYPSQYENDGESERHQKSAAVPLVAAVFAPETHHHHSGGGQPYWWH